MLGLTFKEDCPDLRNTRVDRYRPRIAAVESDRSTCSTRGPIPTKRNSELGMRPLVEPVAGNYDAIVLAVAHRQFREMGAEEDPRLRTRGAVIYDVKHVLRPDSADGRL